MSLGLPAPKERVLGRWAAPVIERPARRRGWYQGPNFPVHQKPRAGSNETERTRRRRRAESAPPPATFPLRRVGKLPKKTLIELSFDDPSFLEFPQHIAQSAWVKGLAPTSENVTCFLTWFEGAQPSCSTGCPDSRQIIEEKHTNAPSPEGSPSVPAVYGPVPAIYCTLILRMLRAASSGVINFFGERSPVVGSNWIISGATHEKKVLMDNS